MSNQIGSLKMGQKFKKTPAGEIPVDWGVATISDLCQVNSEVIKESTPPDTQLKYIDIASIERTGSISIPKDMEFKDAPSRARRIVKAGDIIVSTVRPYLKAFARVTDLSENLIASTGFAVLRPNPNVNGSYVYQHILSDSFVKYLEGRMTGSSYPAVNSSAVAEYQMPVPTAMEQEKIGRILSEIDTLVDKVVAEIKKTKELKNGLMCQLFTRGIGHKKFKKTSIGEIPTGWELVELGNECAVTKLAGFEYTKFFQYKTDGKIIALRALNIKGEELDLSDVQTIDLSVSNGLLRSKLFEGDVVMTYIGNIGDVLRIPESNRFHLAPNVAKITPTAKYHSWFLLRALQSTIAQRQMRSLTATTAMPSLTMQQIRKIILPKPSLTEQDEITKILSIAVDNIKREEEGLSKLLTLRAALMRVLLTGKVRVI